MEKTKYYKLTRFSADTIRMAAKEFHRLCKSKGKLRLDKRLVVEVDEEKWSHDSEDEFFADYRRSKEYAYYRKVYYSTNSTLEITVFEDHTRVSVESPERSKIEADP